MARSLAWICLTCTLTIGALPLATSASEGTDAKLDRGEILVSTRSVAGSELPEAIVQAVVDAPPDKVWKIIEDCDNYKRNMPRVAASRTVQRAGSKVTCEVTIDMPFPLSDLTAVTEADHSVGPPQWKRAWKFVRGDYKRNEGSWTLTAFDAEGKRTRVVYRVLADPNVSVPNAILRKAQESALPDLIKRLRQVVR